MGGEPQVAVDAGDETVRLLAQLPPGQRTVIVLAFFNDLTDGDIAAELGLSVGAVKSAKSRGLAALRRRRVDAEPEGTRP